MKKNETTDEPKRSESELTLPELARAAGLNLNRLQLLSLADLITPDRVVSYRAKTKTVTTDGERVEGESLPAKLALFNRVRVGEITRLAEEFGALDSGRGPITLRKAPKPKPAAGIANVDRATPAQPAVSFKDAVAAAVQAELAKSPVYQALKARAESVQADRIRAIVKTGLNPGAPIARPTAESPSQALALEKAGEFEELYTLLSKSEQAQYQGPANYAAFRRAQSRGVVRYSGRAPLPRFTARNFATQ